MLDDTKQRKLARVFEALASQDAGERDVAAAALDQFLTTLGLTWRDVAIAFAQSTAPTRPPALAPNDDAPVAPPDTDWEHYYDRLGRDSWWRRSGKNILVVSECGFGRGWVAAINGEVVSAGGHQIFPSPTMAQDAADMADRDPNFY
ncbi:MAG: hypothetical protein ACJ8AH_06840 [Stellaceae bacterium]